MRDSPYRRAYEFQTATGENVRFEINTVDIDVGALEFFVGGRWEKKSMDGATANAVAMRLMTHLREDARTRPDGYQYQGGAYTGDNYGTQRALAYQAVGLTRPAEADSGNMQYGIVRGGKVRPDLAALHDDEGSRRFQEYNDAWASVRDRVRTNR